MGKEYDSLVIDICENYDSFMSLHMGDRNRDINIDTIKELFNKEGFKEAWESWYSYRKNDLKKRLTPSQVVGQLKKLHEFDNPIDSINNSITNGWTGLFESGDKKPKDGIYSDFDAIQYCKKYNIDISYKGDKLTGLTRSFMDIFERVEENKWRKRN